MSERPTCSKIGCDKPAIGTVAFRLWSKIAGKSTPPAESFTPITICEEHAKGLPAEKEVWFGPKQCPAIAGAFMVAGKAEPDIETAEIFCRRNPEWSTN